MSRFFKGLLALAVVALLGAPARAAELVDRVVAVVNGEIITLFELNDSLAKLVQKTQGVKVNPSDPQYSEIRKQLLNNLVNDILLKQEAARVGLKVSDGEVDGMIDEIKKKNGFDDAAINAQLAKEGTTRKEFVENLRMDTLRKRIIGYMVNRKILVTDDEIRKYYEANKGNIPTSQAISRKPSGNIGFIMVPTMKEAETVRDQIQKGLSFADAARKYSVGPGREQGGFLGDVTLKDLAPPLRKALEAAPQGQVTQPVNLDGKVVLLILKPKGEAVEAAPAAAPAAPAVASGDIPAAEREQIQELLYRQKFEELFQEYIDKLRSKSVVEIRL